MSYFLICVGVRVVVRAMGLVVGHVMVSVVDYSVIHYVVIYLCHHGWVLSWL